MIKHIVLWKLKDEAEGAGKPENLEKMKTLLEGLPGVIPEIKAFEIGIPGAVSDAESDIALVSAFETREALARYQEHPQHLAAARFIRAVTAQRAVADYETA